MATIKVPRDYLSIQEAVDSASPGDEILVRDGIYNENIIIDSSKNNIKIFADGSKVILHGTGLMNQRGFYLKNTSSVEIKGFQIKNFYFGIYCLASNNIFSGNNISYNNYGIYVVQGINNTIKDNVVSFNIYRSLVLSSSIENLIKDNTIEESGYGIYLFGSSYNQIINNSLSKNQYSGIYVVGRHKGECNVMPFGNNQIEGNLIKKNGNGVYIYNSSYNYIKNNTLKNNSYKGIYTNTPNKIQDNLIEGNGEEGIFTKMSLVEENKVIGNDYGICGNESIIAKNEVYSNKHFGILAFELNDISENIISENGSNGMHIFSKNTVTCNKIEKNLKNGISLEGENNTVHNNNIENNIKSGVLIQSYSIANGITLNVVKENKEDGMLIKGETNNLIKNTIFSNEGKGINLIGNKNTVKDNRLKYNTQEVEDI